MKKIIMIGLLTMLGYADYNSDCVFLENEILRYEFKVQHARDRYEYDKFQYILKKYKYNYGKYCTRVNQYKTAPFRTNQKD